MRTTLIGLPLTVRRSGFSARIRIYHQSSHLRDEYLLRGEDRTAESLVRVSRVSCVPGTGPAPPLRPRRADLSARALRRTVALRPILPGRHFLRRRWSPLRALSLGGSQNSHISPAEARTSHPFAALPPVLW